MIFDKEVQEYFEDDPVQKDRNIIKTLQRRFDSKFSSSHGQLPAVLNLGTPDRRKRFAYGKINETGVFTRKGSNNMSMEPNRSNSRGSNNQLKFGRGRDLTRSRGNLLALNAMDNIKEQNLSNRNSHVSGVLDVRNSNMVTRPNSNRATY